MSFDALTITRRFLWHDGILSIVYRYFIGYLITSITGLGLDTGMAQVPELPCPPSHDPQGRSGIQGQGRSHHFMEILSDCCGDKPRMSFLPPVSFAHPDRCLLLTGWLAAFRLPFPHSGCRDKDKHKDAVKLMQVSFICPIFWLAELRPAGP